MWTETRNEYWERINFAHTLDRDGDSYRKLLDAFEHELPAQWVEIGRMRYPDRAHVATSYRKIGRKFGLSGVRIRQINRQLCSRMAQLKFRANGQTVEFAHGFIAGKEATLQELLYVLNAILRGLTEVPEQPTALNVLL